MTLRRRIQQEVNARINKFKGRVLKLIEEEDAFGLKQVHNTRWQFQTSDQQLDSFRKWAASNLDDTLLAVENDEVWLKKYIEQSYRKGAGRAFDDAKKSLLNEGEFNRGERSQFLEGLMGGPAGEERVKLLASRTLSDLQGVSDAMGQRMGQILTDGLIQGSSARDIARSMNQAISKITKNRALTIARTEIIRAHAEGQLDALENLGVTEIGVMVEWSTTGDDRVCPLCQPLDGIVVKVKEARGMLPRHPNCRCAYIPANVGESTAGQKRKKSQIKAAIKKSVAVETKAKDKREKEKESNWVGADKRISTKRPESPVGDE